MKTSSHGKTKSKAKGNGKVRIIAGQWRSRHLKVPSAVRPTQDAMRETIFNVLQPMINDQNCLDLFAGSGSLGLEALSRGAANATFVEQSAPVAMNLKATVDQLGARALVIKQDALRYLGKEPDERFNLAFADPPYRLSARPNWWPRLLAKLVPHLDANAAVCLESAAPIHPGTGWRQLKSGQNGAAHWCIIAR